MEIGRPGNQKKQEEKITKTEQEEEHSPRKDDHAVFHERDPREFNAARPKRIIGNVKLCNANDAATKIARKATCMLSWNC